VKFVEWFWHFAKKEFQLRRAEENLDELLLYEFVEWFWHFAMEEFQLRRAEENLDELLLYEHRQPAVWGRQCRGYPLWARLLHALSV
jgi:hypothetical protein